MNKRTSRYKKRGRRPQTNLQSNSTLRSYDTMAMKKRSCSMLLSFLSIWIVLTASAQGGQVLTDEVKLWAKETIVQEKTFETISVPNTVAILYFHNKTGWSDLDLLQKGLTLMLITDLSKVKEIQLVERVKIQALAEELGLGVSGLVASDTAPEVGKLLGVEHVIGGDILKARIDDFRLTSNMLNVPAGEIYGQVSTEGKLLAELFRMEKDLLFEIINRLKIELTPELELELKKQFTTSIDAFRRLLQGLEESDRGNYERAAASYQASLKKDPGFTLAADFLRELKDLQLWAGRIGDDSRAEAYTKLVDYIREPVFDYIPDKIDPFIREKIYEEKIETNFDEFIPGELNPVDDPSTGYQGWGYTWSGPYKPGLQTVGSDQDWSSSPKLFRKQEDLDSINSDSFLAYKEQQEEDFCNRKILEMYREAVQGDLRQAIDWHLENGDIRDLDDLLTQLADAQAGRVLKDVHGNWVQVQQYILRPSAQEVIVYNISTAKSASDAENKMVWKTTFTGEGYPIDNDLRGLPWPDWMRSIEGEGGRYINNASSVELNNMSVKVTNPSDESLQEQRWFDPRPTEGTWIGDWQDIDRDELRINDSDPYEYVGNGALEGRQYTVTSDPDFPGNFNYVLGDGRSINVACFIVGDIDTVAPGGSLEGIHDIWDVLRVNMGEGAPDIGDNNLEFTIDKDKQVFSSPIDVVHIPMCRMLWKPTPEEVIPPDIS